MPEYDAFGREIGEDPLAALRDATATTTSPEPPATVAAQPAAEFAPPVASPPRFVRRRRRGGSVVGLLAVVAAIGGIGLVVNGFVNRVEDFTGSLPGLGEVEPGAAGGSLLRPANLSAAIDVMRRSGLGDPIRLRVRPGRIDATLGGGLGVSRVRVGADLDLTTSGIRPRDYPRPVPLRRIDPTAPQRLAAGRPVEYVELIRGRPVRWRAVLADGTTITGDRAGRAG